MEKINPHSPHTRRFCVVIQIIFIFFIFDIKAAKASQFRAASFFMAALFNSRHRAKAWKYGKL
jgi:uncharacterized membrane protein SirB2